MTLNKVGAINEAMKTILVLIKMILILGIVGAVTGCNRNMNRSKLASGNFSHTVQFRDEGLDVISFWYTGTVDNWEVISERSGGLPRRNLERGQIVLIPENLIVQKRPLTQAFINMVQVGKQSKTANPSGKPKAKIAAADQPQTVPQPPVEVVAPAEEIAAETAESSNEVSASADSAEPEEQQLSGESEQPAADPEIAEPEEPVAPVDPVESESTNRNGKSLDPGVQEKVSQIESEPDPDRRKQEYDKLLESLMQTQ